MKDAFKIKRGLNVQPIDPADVVNPEAGDIIVDSTDDNRMKVYDPTAGEFSAVGTGGSSGNILADIEKLTPVVTNVVAAVDTTVFLPIDDNNKSVKATFSGSDGTIRYEAAASADLDGVQGVVKVWIKTSVENLSLVATKDGVAQNNGLTINSTNKWRQYEIPVVLGDADYGFEIQASGAVSGDVYIDEAFVTVEKVIQQLDTTITDPIAYSPTLSSGVTTSGDTVVYSRVGKYLHIQGELRITNTGNTNRFTITIPSGLEIDTNDIGTSNAALGSGYWLEAGVAFRTITVTFETTNTITFIEDNAGNFIQGSDLSNADRITFSAKIPIVGWSSEKSTVVTQDTELTAKTANVFSATIEADGTVVGDTFDFINGNCSKPSTGNYQCNLNTNIGITQLLNCSVGENFTDRTTVYSRNNSTTNRIDFVHRVTSTNLNADGRFSIVCQKHENDINKSATIVGKFENINSTDLIKVKASTDAGQNIPTTSTEVLIYEDVEAGTNIGNWYNPTTGIFTSPRDSNYLVCGAFMFNTASWTIGTRYQFTANTSGGQLKYFTREEIVTTNSDYYQDNSCLEIKLLKNETFYFGIYQNTGTDKQIFSTSAYNFMSISELPDYEAIVKNLSDQKVKCQTKTLSGNTTVGATGFLADLQFNNLDINKYYSLSTRVINSVNSSTIDNDYLYWRILGFDRQLSVNFQTSNTGNHSMTSGLNAQMIKPTSSTSTFEIYAVSATSYLIAGSWVELCELPDTYVVTTKF